MPGILISTDCTLHVHLIVGSNPLAASRAWRSLDLGARVKVLAPESSQMHYGLQQKIDDGLVEWIKKETVSREDLVGLGREEVDGVVDAVFVTLQVGCVQNAQISALCNRLRIPVNVADSPALCSFTLLSTYTDGPLQIGVTTSGRGCKLAARIRREIVTALPPGLGEACDRLGRLRRRIWEEDYARSGAPTGGDDEGVVMEEEDEDLGQKATFNKLILQGDYEAAKGRRIRWLSQMCEYWPLEKLCGLTEDDIDGLLQSYNAEQGYTKSDSSPVPATTGDSTPPPTSCDIPPPPPTAPRQGTIHLIGSGPGHPDLLTTAALKAIHSADVILADKLVPAAVLSIIPRRTPVHIARKFPGNADAAQEELLNLGLSAVKEGKQVVRLKQGDPYIYGRGGEEYDFFSKHGYPVSVIPGITSALSSTVFAAIPATHRGVADQVLICTGTGRKGAPPEMPEYVPSRTTVFLMVLHRLGGLVESLVLGKKWPGDLPCAVVERASCPDQRVIRATLETVVAAVEVEGSRPPGLLVLGWACEVLGKKKGVVGGRKWAVEEGFTGF